MTEVDLVLIAGVFFCTSIVSVVTGATSLVTVPAMLWLGMDLRTALATNMLALVFLSAGAVSKFWQSGEVHLGELRWPLVLTGVGSVAGAFLVFALPENVIKVTVAVAMLAVAGLVLRPRSPVPAPAPRRRASTLMGSACTLALAVYGGFFSGGYVTLLTGAWTSLFGMSFKKAVIGTKVANLVSSLVAVVIFAANGLIDWWLGALLSAAAFSGAIVGARWALRLNELALRRIFAATVAVLSVKMLVVDVPWSALRPS